MLCLLPSYQRKSTKEHLINIIVKLVYVTVKLRQRIRVSTESVMYT